MSNTPSRTAYWNVRNKQVLTIDIGDADIRARMLNQAKADNRTVSEWFRHFIIPVLVTILEREEALTAKRTPKGR